MTTKTERFATDTLVYDLTDPNANDLGVRIRYIDITPEGREGMRDHLRDMGPQIGKFLVDAIHAQFPGNPDEIVEFMTEAAAAVCDREFQARADREDREDHEDAENEGKWPVLPVVGMFVSAKVGEMKRGGRRNVPPSVIYPSC